MDERARRGPLASPGFHLWNASLSWAAAIAAALQPLELTHVQFFILGAVSWLGKTTGHAPTQSEVATFNGMDRMMISKVVRSLEARRIVRRASDPDDARAWRLHLTAQGAELLPKAVAIVRQVDHAFFAPIAPRARSLADDLETLTERSRLTPAHMNGR